MPVLREKDDYETPILKQKSGEVWSVSPDQSVYEAIERMADKAVGALLSAEPRCNANSLK